ncbi:MAG: bifunctional phosphopantothenoylcysteine decarboxylase/phosphopantothenate--cysteine ligase CoaBC [Gammaproteobacteria bacterium]|nr:bifunctional phosphopantothenoylcysteine decarboxylase/phosphopantothenate--cysteine ligase CoaBC [Gammaproteobacteria bacterium]
MNKLTNKNIVLGVCGSIAAYKSADLIRRLTELGANIRVVMTQSANEFITPLTLQTLSQNPVHQHLLDCDSESNMSHIELARWADIILIAPCSANFIAKLAHGAADDLLSTVCLATRSPIIIVPAMNNAMWENPATQENIHTLEKREVIRFGPAAGNQACGETGLGRMQEPVQIINNLNEMFQAKLLHGQHILITAGPTQEDIDPVRYISNRSSGKMGFAIAKAAVEAGSKVTLICGPVQRSTPRHVDRIDVRTAEQMNTAVSNFVTQADIFISTAAVADYRPQVTQSEKIKKTSEDLKLELVRNPDILLNVANAANPPFTVGFAAETNNVKENALTKLKLKSLDMIAANQVGNEKGGFDSDENALAVFWPGGEILLPMATKEKIARELIAIVAERFQVSRFSETNPIIKNR